MAEEQEQPAKLANLGAQKASATSRWASSWLSKSYEAAIDVTLGNAASIVGGFPCGSTNEIVTGGTASLVLDPSGWIDNDTIQKVQDLAMPMGEWSGLFGAGRSLHYGPETSIHHGAEITRRSVQTFDASNPRTTFVSGIVTAASALTLLGWKKQNTDPVAWENLVRTLGPRGLAGTLLNLLIEYEKATGETDAGIEKQAEASSLNTQSDALGSDYQSLILDLADKATDKGSALSSQGDSDMSDQQQQASSVDTSLDDAESAGEEMPDSDDSGDDDSSSDSEESDDSSDEDNSPDTSDLEFGSDEADLYQCYDGLLATGARHVSIRARAVDDDDTDPSLIHLDAQGADGQDNGIVAINSTGQATIVCGPAAVQVRRSSETGQVDITTGDDGEITLTSGGDSGSKAVLNPDGITFTVGDSSSGAVIQMTSDGIKLSVGGDGGPCLELTTSSATMSCSSSSVAVDSSNQTTQSTNISHTADSSFAVNGGSIDIEGSAETTIKGGMVMIN